MPANMMIDRMPIAAMVRAAFSPLGGWNAGTPLEIASTPVSAVQPEENARSARNSSASPVRPTWPGSGLICQPALSATGASPKTVRPRPMAIIERGRRRRTGRWGRRRSRPDSRTPRRFIAVSSATNPRLIATR